MSNETELLDKRLMATDLCAVESGGLSDELIERGDRFSNA